tara:strand:+ start:7753 stop:7965 length:213 start_codon:yes stop_codon:yes gene_type:complete
MILPPVGRSDMVSNRKAELTYQLRKALLSLGRALSIAQLEQDFEAQADIKRSIDHLKKRLKILSHVKGKK